MLAFYPRFGRVVHFGLLAAAVVSMAVGCRRGDRPPRSTTVVEGTLRGVALDKPVAKPSFVFRATNGKPFDFQRETADRVALLFFGYTNCPDVCPLHMANIAAVLAKMPWEERNRFVVVFVTTDPARDTPEKLRAFLDRFDASFVGLSAPVDEVNRVQVALGLSAAFRESGSTGDTSTYGVGHAAQVLAFSRDGQARVVYPFGIRQDDWAHDLPLLARGDGASGAATRVTPGSR
jgi:protein SCO1/2